MELLGAIKDAEDEAAGIVHAAEKRAKEIEDAANLEIEKMNTDTQNKAAKLTIYEESIPADKPRTVEIKADKKKFDAAKELIIGEFHKRWAK